MEGQPSDRFMYYTDVKLKETFHHTIPSKHREITAAVGNLKGGSEGSQGSRGGDLSSADNFNLR